MSRQPAHRRCSACFPPSSSSSSSSAHSREASPQARSSSFPGDPKGNTVKFTDGFWHTRPGVTPLFAQEAYDIVAGDSSLTVTAPTKVIQGRGDTLNCPTLTVTLSSPLPNIVGVRIEHFQGLGEEVGFDLVGAQNGHGEVSVTDAAGTLTSGGLSATVAAGAPWNLSFSADGNILTSSGHQSVAYVQVVPVS